MPDVFIHEVAPRDGFQIETRFVPTSEKVTLINALSDTGITAIEVSSFVSPRAIPNLADAAEVFSRIDRHAAVTYTALVPNMRGAERAVAADADEMNFVISVSEAHNLANMQMTPAQSLQQLRCIVEDMKDELTKINGTVATAFGCPFEGPQSASAVLGMVETLMKLGCSRVTLADTTGMGNPHQVGALVTQVFRHFPDCNLTLHFHDTRGMGLANVCASLNAGARRFDASLGGLGGCPFAPGASGNICTEDVVHMLEAMGVETGIDLESLILLSQELPALLSHDVPGHVRKAGSSRRLHDVPLVKTASLQEHV
jgi:hydroxymethylglutaryl-CoA lyase